MANGCALDAWCRFIIVQYGQTLLDHHHLLHDREYFPGLLTNLIAGSFCEDPVEVNTRSKIIRIELHIVYSIPDILAIEQSCHFLAENIVDFECNSCGCR